MILVLDSDTATFRKIQRAHIECMRAPDEDEALRLAGECQPEAIVASARYSDDETIAALDAVAPSSPIVVVSENASDWAARRVLQAGAVAYLDDGQGDLDRALRLGIFRRLIASARAALAARRLR